MLDRAAARSSFSSSPSPSGSSPSPAGKKRTARHDPPFDDAAAPARGRVTLLHPSSGHEQPATSIHQPPTKSKSKSRAIASTSLKRRHLASTLVLEPGSRQINRAGPSNAVVVISSDDYPAPLPAHLAGPRPFPMPLPMKDSSSRAKYTSLALPLLPAISSDPPPPRDPATLCPFCDEDLPTPMTQTCKDMLRQASNRGTPAPRPGNAQGLRAHFPNHIAACERHRFERKILPRAIREGWPTEIDFDIVFSRVQAAPVRAALDRVLADPKQNSFFIEAMEHVVTVGARAAESAMGQYATMDRVQPGYYGERGVVVIQQALLAIYPPEELQLAQTRFSPLTSTTFMHSVLVPEVGLALIMEDSRQPREAALKIMRDSSRYGNLMFRDEDNADGAGDRFMRALARDRRKQLEQDEEACSDAAGGVDSPVFEERSRVNLHTPALNCPIPADETPSLSATDEQVKRDAPVSEGSQDEEQWMLQCVRDIDASDDAYWAPLFFDQVDADL